MKGSKFFLFLFRYTSKVTNRTCC